MYPGSTLIFGALDDNLVRLCHEPAMPRAVGSLLLWHVGSDPGHLVQGHLSPDVSMGE